MTIRKISIRQIKGVESLDLDFRAATLLILAGPNGCGKTSILDAIRAPFEKGHDPELIRHGAKRGELRIDLLDDRDVPEENRIINIRVVITPGGTDRRFTHADGREVPAPRAILDQIAPILGLDPARFLKFTTKEATEEMLRILPVEVTEKEIMDASEGEAKLGPGGNLLGLRELVDVRDDIYQRRRVANVEAKKLDSTIEKLTDSLPETTEAIDWRAVAAKARKNAQIVSDLLEAERSKIRADGIAREQYYRAEFDRRVAEIRENMSVLQDRAAAEAQPHLDRLRAEEATAQEKRSAQDRALGAAAEIEKMREQAGSAGRLATKLDRVLGKIDALKKKALDALPIEGLEFDGEQFCDRDGDAFTPWEHINKARKLDISFAIAAMTAEKAGGVRFMVVDEGENLDEEGLAAIHAAAKANKFKIALTSVTRNEEDLKLLEKIGAQLGAPVISPGSDGALTVRKVG